MPVDIQTIGLAMVQDTSIQCYELYQDGYTIQDLMQHYNVEQKTIDIWLAMADICLKKVTLN